jgi:hypothetical protein
MTARGGVPTPPDLWNMGPREGPTYPLGIAERRHRNLPSLVKERNPGNRLNGAAYYTSIIIDSSYRCDVYF